MKNFIDKKIFDYTLSKSSDEPEILKELNRETHLKILNPRMLSGNYQGRILSLISKIIRPSSILEIGTYTGYSTICFSEGLDDNGFIHTIDHNEELIDIQNKYFNKAGISKKVIQYSGDAIKIIDKLNFEFDLVFIDADKENYLKYYETCIDLIDKNRLIVIDNVLWHGEVIDDTKNDKFISIIREFNTHIKKDSRVIKNIIPIGDGLTICIKK